MIDLLQVASSRLIYLRLSFYDLTSIVVSLNIFVKRSIVNFCGSCLACLIQRIKKLMSKVNSVCLIFKHGFI